MGGKKTLKSMCDKKKPALKKLVSCTFSQVCMNSKTVKINVNETSFSNLYSNIYSKSIFFLLLSVCAAWLFLLNSSKILDLAIKLLTKGWRDQGECRNRHWIEISRFTEYLFSMKLVLDDSMITGHTLGGPINHRDITLYFTLHI